jgi:hypothetical protein
VNEWSAGVGVVASWLGFTYEYSGVRGKEFAGEPDVSIRAASRSGVWRAITPNVVELPTQVSRRFPLIPLQHCLFTPELQWQPRGK